jgi:hypothetical protein
MREPHDSDFLTWTLAAAAVLIMAVAVRINADEPASPRPEVHDPAEPERYPLRFPERYPERDPQRAGHPPAHAPARV